jgi:hypothetical protein
MSTAQDYKIARMWKGKILYFNMLHTGMQFCDKVLPNVFPGKLSVANVGCVANTGLIIADWIGCKPLILVGCDFSYPDKKMNCDTYDIVDGELKKIEIDWQERIAKRTGLMQYKGIYTYPPFLDYLKTMENLNKVMKAEIVNATEGGIIDCVPVMTLKEAKDKFCNMKITKIKSGGY